MAIQIDIPAQYNTYHEKYAWIYTLETKLTFLYNVCRRWYRVGGMTQQQYNALPSYIRNIVNYNAQLNNQQYSRVLKLLTRISERVQARKIFLRQNVIDADMDCVLDRDIVVS